MLSIVSSNILDAVTAPPPRSSSAHEKLDVGSDRMKYVKASKFLGARIKQLLLLDALSSEDENSFWNSDEYNLGSLLHITDSDVTSIANILPRLRLPKLVAGFSSNIHLADSAAVNKSDKEHRHQQGTVVAAMPVTLRTAEILPPSTSTGSKTLLTVAGALVTSTASETLLQSTASSSKTPASKTLPQGANVEYMRQLLTTAGLSADGKKVDLRNRLLLAGYTIELHKKSKSKEEKTREPKTRKRVSSTGWRVLKKKPQKQHLTRQSEASEEEEEEESSEDNGEI